MSLAMLAYALALFALAFFCAQLARRSDDLAWGYWLAAVVLALQAVATAYGFFQSIS
jgi:hypothetical protein